MIEIFSQCQIIHKLPVCKFGLDRIEFLHVVVDAHWLLLHHLHCEAVELTCDRPLSRIEFVFRKAKRVFQVLLHHSSGFMLFTLLTSSRILPMMYGKVESPS